MMKIKDRLENKYFEYLYNWMCDDRFGDDISYKKLFTHLHMTDFTYSIYKDKNRAEDGLSLRYNICRAIKAEQLYNNEYYLNKPCSVLEMLIALAVKCEDIMDDLEYGDRTTQWFWGMINNLGLGAMYDSRFDKEYVEKCIKRFLTRTYKPDGRGGLFTIRNCESDLREVEIWYQLCWYLHAFV